MDYAQEHFARFVILCFYIAFYIFSQGRIARFVALADVTTFFVDSNYMIVFVQNLKGNTLAVTDRERERFRTFLLALLTNFLRNQHAKEATLKRGGAMRLVSLDLRDESGGLVHQPASLNSSEKEFDPQWAITVLNAVMEAMRMIRSSIVAYLGKRGCDVWEASQPTATHGTLTKLSPGGVCCPMT